MAMVASSPGYASPAQGAWDASAGCWSERDERLVLE
jgi:hypothetical protein